MRGMAGQRNAEGRTEADGWLHVLREQLEQEYGGRIPAEEIDDVARQALAEFRDVRINDYVPVLAWKRARGRLRWSS
jgi:Protein of unknown function (DUF3562)